MELIVTTVVVSPFQQNCRIVKDAATGDGVIIDPGDEAERILAAVDQSGARITHILATHAHLDHVGAVSPVKAALGVPFALHAADWDLLRELPARVGRRPHDVFAIEHWQATAPSAHLFWRIPVGVEGRRVAKGVPE